MRTGTPGFNGVRLREAREARAMTAIALADLVGVTRSAISQYENGHLTPSPEVVRQLAKALNVYIQRFLRPIPPRKHGPVFYRCMSAATKRARLRAERRYEWLREMVAFLEQHVRFVPVNFPNVNAPSDPSKIDHELIEEAATAARRFWGLQDGPISNVAWLLENNGCIVSRADLDATSLDAFSEWHPDDARPFIVLASGKESASRSRFDAAHELGHLLLHRGISSSALSQNQSFRLIEEQAHRFAGAFLLPAASFTEAFYAPTLDSFRVLKGRWRVSIVAMIMRASDLHLISDDQKQKLLMNVARRKWRTREPLDDSLEPERPRFIKKCLDLLISKRIVAAHEIPFQLGIPPHDLEQLAGLDPGTLGGDGAPVELLGDTGRIDGDDDGSHIIRFPFAS